MIASGAVSDVLSVPGVILDTDVILALLVGFASSRVGRSLISGNTSKLRRVARAGEAGADAASAVGRDISADLRRLQAGRATVLDVDGIVGGLVPAMSALLRDGRFLSVSVTRDGRAVRLSVKDGSDYIEFYSSDPDHAEDLGEGIRGAVVRSE